MELGSLRGEVLVAGEEEQFRGDTVTLQSLDTHHEEETCQDAVGDEMQDNEQRAAHGSQCEEALCQVADALLDDVGSFESVFALVLALGVEFADRFGDAEGFGVEGSLRDEAVGEG